jgi:tetratricopeptide (TPR) repeat protein
MTDAIQPAGASAGPPTESSAETAPAPEGAIRAGAPAVAGDASAPIPIPPPAPAPVDDERDASVQHWLRRLDASALVLLLVLAFFLGSFVAQNSSLWVHLATGRLIAAGDYHFGVDPFSYATQDQYWANVNWLYDLGLYTLYNLAGGAVVVVCKALLVVLLALVLFQTRRPGESWWPSVLCVGLALLAASRAMLLDPFLLTLLCLAATLYLLYREPLRQVGAAPRSRLSSLWLLPPLFALWANLDAWFILGPITVALVVIGELLQGAAPAGAGAAALRARRRTLALVLPVGLAACLLNPHGYRVFVLPPELALLVLQTGGWLPSWMLAGGTTLQEIGKADPSFWQLLPAWESPLDRLFWTNPGRGLNVAGLAYFPLIVLGFASFVVTGPGRGGLASFASLIVWSAFLLLSTAHARLIPLFAVVAAPITAINLQELAGRLTAAPGAAGRWRPWALAGRAATLVACLVLLVLAWVGWLHPGANDPRASRHVAWEVRADPLLRQAAEQLGRWHDAGQLGRGLNYSFDIAHYTPWFAPSLKHYYDTRFELFAGQGPAIGELRRSLRGLVAKDDEAGEADDRLQSAEKLRELFQTNEADHLILTRFGQPRLSQESFLPKVVATFVFQPGEWTYLYSDGWTDVFGHADGHAPEHSRHFREIALEPSALAFGPRQPEPNLPDGPRPFLAEPDPWRKVLAGPPAPSGGIEEADNYLFLYSVLGARDKVLHEKLLQEPGRSLWHVTGWGAAFGDTAVGAGGWAAPLYLCGTGGIEMHRGNVPRDMGPPALPLLAVQAARRAVAANPTDPQGYRALGDAYRALWQQEQYWARGTAQYPQAFRPTLRRRQLTAALQEQLRLDPDNPGNVDVHLTLADIYGKLYYLDVMLEHREKALKLMGRLVATSPEQAKALDDRRKALEQNVEGLSKEVNKRREDYQIHAAGQPLQARVAFALDQPYRFDFKNKEVQDPRGRGLALEALKVLKEASGAGMDKNEAAFAVVRQLNLLLDLGEVKEVRDALQAEGLADLLGPVYPLTETSVAAILGDYPLFDRAIQDLDQSLTKLERKLGKQEPVTQAMSAILMETIMDPRVPLQPLVKTIFHLVAQEQMSFDRPAQMHFRRGLMALEHGDTAAAAPLLRDSMRLFGRRAEFTDLAIAARYLALLEKNR